MSSLNVLPLPLSTTKPTTTTTSSSTPSSFLAPTTLTKPNQLASLHLSHNNSLPVILSTTVTTASEAGYAEGVVTNTKFGSFPHSTLIGVPWGSQVRASKVDTGTRGRVQLQLPKAKKRKVGEISGENDAADAAVDVGSPSGVQLKEATIASSGFIHVLPPTPENWTMGLPHRTQVVYTPDYSYVLHRIRARPGRVLVEAGSGSGSFTHAAIRAVYDGEGKGEVVVNGGVVSVEERKARGRVYTFEFHPERFEKVEIEMRQHGLQELVTTTHRDVYQDGFLLKGEDGSWKSPRANCVFLDLPAPWEALRHLSRAGVDGRPSALDPLTEVHICTFSPCIEQVQKTISAMRKSGWVEIEMVELQHKRIDVRRDFTGLKYDGMRSVNAFAADVDEVLMKLRAAEQKVRAFHAASTDDDISAPEKSSGGKEKNTAAINNSQIDASKTLYMEGTLVHRSEPEIKTHTSYLVFAILPREWTVEDEEHAKDMLRNHIDATPSATKSHRQIKREAKARKKQLANGAGKENESKEASKEDAGH